MTQLEQAMEVVKDLTQMKARLMKCRIELGAVLNTKSDDRSIEPLARIKLRRLQYTAKDMIDSIDEFGE